MVTSYYVVMGKFVTSRFLCSILLSGCIAATSQARVLCELNEAGHHQNETASHSEHAHEESETDHHDDDSTTDTHHHDKNDSCCDSIGEFTLQTSFAVAAPSLIQADSLNLNFRNSILDTSLQFKAKIVWLLATSPPRPYFPTSFIVLLI